MRLWVVFLAALVSGGCKKAEGPVVSKLTPGQIQRLEQVHAVLHEVDPTPLPKLLEDFTRDQNPEGEIVIWEQIAAAYAKFVAARERSLDARHEAYSLLLMRSGSPEEKVLRTPLWAQHHNGVFRSDDTGQTWVSIDNVPPSVFGFAVAVHPSKPDTAWLVPATRDDQRVPASAAVVVSRTDDGEKTWRVQKNGLPQSNAYDLVYRHCLDVDASGDTLAFASTTGSLWITEDGGEQWAEVSSHLPPVYAVRFG